MLYRYSTCLSIKILFLVIALTISTSALTVFKLHAQSEDEPFAGQPAWSPSGEKIAFVSNTTGNQDLWIINADGTSEENITSSFSSLELFPKWSPDEGYILFQSLEESEPEAVSDIQIINVQTHSVLNLTQQLDDPVTLGDFAWSPNSRFIAFSATSSEMRRNIWVIDKNGENLTNITNESGGFTHTVSWLSDSEIAFIDDGKFKVHNLQDGSFLDLVNNIKSYEFSPDRHFITWTTNNNQSSINADVWLMNLETLQTIRLTEINLIPDTDLFWSPNSRYLLFISMCDQRTTTLMVFDMDENRVTDITNCNLGLVAYPSWSPTSQSLVFQTDESGSVDLWQVTVDGLNPHKISESSY